MVPRAVAIQPWAESVGRGDHHPGAAGGDQGAAADVEGAVDVERAVAVGGRAVDGDLAAGDRGAAVGVEAVAAGPHLERAAVDVQGERVVGRHRAAGLPVRRGAVVRRGGVDAVVGGVELDVAVVDDDQRTLERLVGAGHVDRAAADEDLHALDAVVLRGDGELAALDEHEAGAGVLGVVGPEGVTDGVDGDGAVGEDEVVLAEDAVVDGRHVDGAAGDDQAVLADDAVVAVAGDRQRPGAADGQVGRRVEGAGGRVLRRVGVRRRVGEGVGAAVGEDDHDRLRVDDVDRGGRLGGDRRVVEHEAYDAVAGAVDDHLPGQLAAQDVGAGGRDGDGAVLDGDRVAVGVGARAGQRDRGGVAPRRRRCRRSRPRRRRRARPPRSCRTTVAAAELLACSTRRAGRCRWPRTRCTPRGGRRPGSRPRPGGGGGVAWVRPFGRWCRGQRLVASMLDARPVEAVGPPCASAVSACDNFSVRVDVSSPDRPRPKDLHATAPPRRPGHRTPRRHAACRADRAGRRRDLPRAAGDDRRLLPPARPGRHPRGTTWW